MAGTGGKREGAGRKSKAEELGLNALIDSVWSETAQKKVFKKLAEDCLSDDFYVRSESRKLLLAYKFGKPAQTLDIGNKPGETFKQKFIVEVVNGSNEDTSE
jgi:hypothetical protein